MNIGIIDVDSHNFPNLALMKISAWHKAQGDTVDWADTSTHYDRVYMSKVFDETYSRDMPFVFQANEIIRGGTGYGLDNKLPDEIEHIYPDYSLYPKLTKDTAYGFLTRGCPRGCPFCIVAEKEGRKSVKVADVSEFWNGQKNIELLDPNLLACRDHPDLLRQLIGTKARVNFNQGMDCRMLTEQNIEMLNQIKLQKIHFAWDLMNESEAVIRGLSLYAQRTTHRPNGHFAMVYVLTNFNTTMGENLYRIYKLRDMGYDPYVMVYDKPNAPREIKRLQRWCNSKEIFRSCDRFEDYRPKIIKKAVKAQSKLFE